MEKMIIRIQINKGFLEDGKPLLIFPEDVNQFNGLMTCAAYTGHCEGEYSVLMHDSRPIKPEELAEFNSFIYGYRLADFKIVKRK